MILILSVNTSLDRVMGLDRLKVCDVNRARDELWVGGGKALNVLKGVVSLGHRAQAVVAVGGEIGKIIQHLLMEENLDEYCDYFEIRGESRICDVIVDPATGCSTVINSQGPAMSRVERDSLLTMFLAKIHGPGDYLLLTGSLPKGTPVTFYADLILKSRDMGGRCIVDASGEILHASLSASPWLVKVNFSEFMEITPQLERDFDTVVLRNESCWYKQVYSLCSAIAQKGTHIIVTNGNKGSAAWTREGSWVTGPAPVQVVNAVGSGDAFLAGFTANYIETHNFSRALLWATACAASNAQNKMPMIETQSVLVSLASRVVQTELLAEGKEV